MVHGTADGAGHRFAQELLNLGHRVHQPTLTGLGERQHLSSESVDLDTHITDVMNLIKYEDLTDLVLVGHSYAGFVINALSPTECASALLNSSFSMHFSQIQEIPFNRFQDWILNFTQERRSGPSVGGGGIGDTRPCFASFRRSSSLPAPAGLN